MWGSSGDDVLDIFDDVYGDLFDDVAPPVACAGGVFADADDAEADAEDADYGVAVLGDAFVAQPELLAGRL